VGRVVAASDAYAALRLAADFPVDVVFVAEDLPGAMDGFELAGVLRRFSRVPELVFLASSGRRAADAFDVGAVDYLSHPVGGRRLAESLRRVLARRPGMGVPGWLSPAGSPVAVARVPARTPAGVVDAVLPVPSAGRISFVRCSSIRWVEAKEGYAMVHSANGDHLLRVPIGALARRLAEAGLVRIHRSYLVRLNLIEHVRLAGSAGLFVVIDGRKFPVARRRASELCASLGIRRPDATH
jgi:DNA-binding LytR/AlgR family response regulator